MCGFLDVALLEDGFLLAGLVVFLLELALIGFGLFFVDGSESVRAELVAAIR